MTSDSCSIEKVRQLVLAKALPIIASLPLIIRFRQAKLHPSGLAYKNLKSINYCPWRVMLDHWKDRL